VAKKENDGNKDSEEYRKLAKQFGAFHGMSSLANLAALIAGFAHVWALAAGLA
jgi:hypothetical protein